MRLYTTLTTLLAAMLLIGSSAAAACQARCFVGMTTDSCANMAPAMTMQANSSSGVFAPALGQVSSTNVGMTHFQMPVAAALGNCESHVCAPPPPALNNDRAAALRIPVIVAHWPTPDLALDRTIQRASVASASLPSLHSIAAQNSTLRI